MINMKERDMTKNMLSTLREGIRANMKYPVEPLIVSDEPIIKENMLTEWKRMEENAKSKKKVLNEEETPTSSDGNKFVITKSTPQFGDIRDMQESDLAKTIGERIELGNEALIYYKKEDDLVLTGKIKSLNVAFQFRYNDPSGDGCYIWTNALQMTDKNVKTVCKIKDAFDIWNQRLDENGDLMDKLKKAAENNGK